MVQENKYETVIYYSNKANIGTWEYYFTSGKSVFSNII